MNIPAVAAIAAVLLACIIFLERRTWQDLSVPPFFFNKRTHDWGVLTPKEKAIWHFWNFAIWLVLICIAAGLALALLPKG